MPNSCVEVLLIGNDHFFDRDGIYVDSTTGKDYPDQADRWIFFQRAVLDFFKTASPPPSIVHCHDHQTGLIPAYLRKIYSRGLTYAGTRSVFTIHNMGYQGLFPKEAMIRSGFNEAEFYPTSPFEFYGRLNFMKVGITYADLITTVSQTYAREIQQSKEFGYGLEGALRDASQPQDPLDVDRHRNEHQARERGRGACGGNEQVCPMLSGVGSQTRTPTLMPWPRSSGRPANLCGQRRGQLFSVGQVLVGWAIAVMWQWHPLARRSLPGARATLQWISVHVEPIARQIAHELVDQS